MPKQPSTAPMPQQATLWAIMLPVWLAAIDTAIANTALPSIAADLSVTAPAAVWIINAYQLVIVASLLPLAALGQQWGERRVFLIGVGLFAASSWMCSLVDTLPGLTLARALQGLGASAIMGVNLALVQRIYPPQHLGRGVGLNAFVVGLGYTSGPSLAALILSFGPWPWLFAINVPFCLAAAWLGLRHLPKQEHTPRHAFDLPLAGLTAVTLGAGLLAMTHTAQASPWTWVIGLLSLSAISAIAMAWRQRGHPQPMWPSDLLRIPPFALSVATSVSAFATQGLAFVGLPFFIERHLHRAAVDTGLLLSVWALTVAITGPWAGRWSDRMRPALLGSSGLLMLACGMGLLANLSPQATFFDIAWRMAWCGLGFGLFQSPNLKAILSSGPPQRRSGASGMIALARLSGQTMGAALVALCFGAWASQGPQAALWLGCATATVGATVSMARLRFNANIPPPSPHQHQEKSS